MAKITASVAMFEASGVKSGTQRAGLGPLHCGMRAAQFVLSAQNFTITDLATNY